MLESLKRRWFWVLFLLVLLLYLLYDAFNISSQYGEISSDTNCHIEYLYSDLIINKDKSIYLSEELSFHHESEPSLRAIGRIFPLIGHHIKYFDKDFSKTQPQIKFEESNASLISTPDPIALKTLSESTESVHRIYFAFEDESDFPKGDLKFSISFNMSDVLFEDPKNNNYLIFRWPVSGYFYPYEVRSIASNVIFTKPVNISVHDIKAYTQVITTGKADYSIKSFSPINYEKSKINKNLSDANKTIFTVFNKEPLKPYECLVVEVRIPKDYFSPRRILFVGD